jgi:hypothetical protein
MCEDAQPALPRVQIIVTGFKDPINTNLTGVKLKKQFPTISQYYQYHADYDQYMLPEGKTTYTGVQKALEWLDTGEVEIEDEEEALLLSQAMAFLGVPEQPAVGLLYDYFKRQMEEIGIGDVKTLWGHRNLPHTERFMELLVKKVAERLESAHGDYLTRNSTMSAEDAAEATATLQTQKWIAGWVLDDEELYKEVWPLLGDEPRKFIEFRQQRRMRKTRKGRPAPHRTRSAISTFAMSLETIDEENEGQNEGARASDEANDAEHCEEFQGSRDSEDTDQSWETIDDEDEDEDEDRTTGEE